VCRAAKLNQTIEDIEHVRGLENLISPEVQVVLYQRRRATISRVLLEEAYQQEVGEQEIEKIASVSTTNSKVAGEWRQRIAGFNIAIDLTYCR
jgi:hypothetical protein